MICRFKGCGKETHPNLKECPNCWEVRRRLKEFVQGSENLEWALSQLSFYHVVDTGTGGRDYEMLVGPPDEDIEVLQADFKEDSDHQSLRTFADWLCRNKKFRRLSAPVYEWND